MSTYKIINRSDGTIQLIIPAPHGSGRMSANIELPQSQVVDILPYAGTIERARSIPQIIDLNSRNLIQIIES